MIKNIINKIPSLGTDVIVRVESIEAIANCLYGDDLKETVIQKMAAELFQVRGSSFKILEDFPFFSPISLLFDSKTCISRGARNRGVKRVHSFRSIFSSIGI